MECIFFSFFSRIKLGLGWVTGIVYTSDNAVILNKIQLGTLELRWKARFVVWRIEDSLTNVEQKAAQHTFKNVWGELKLFFFFLCVFVCLVAV